MLPLLLLRKLSRGDYEELIRGAEEITRDQGGPKLLRRPDGKMVKLFRRRRLISSGLIWPNSLRFCRAARKLERLGVPSVKVEAAYRVPAIGRHVVVYPALQGAALRDALLVDPNRRESLLAELARFLAELHQKGVYFRAVHFGNLLAGPDGRLALVDISEARFHRPPLGPDRRARNFKPLFAYEEDRAALAAFGLERFLGIYLEGAGLAENRRSDFLERLAQRRPELRDAARALLPTI